ncbi:MAG: hypothetical protein HKK67_07250 [Chlorobiaceae bacterium]|nr:hypothetical protein [Chlorobiaceae bacterium]
MTGILSGYIKLYRRLASWEWYRESTMVHMLVHLLLMANRKPGKWKGIDIQRGQLITGRHALSLQTGISERTCRTCLERLKTSREIAIQTTSRYTLITVLNYDTYQKKNEHADQQTGQTTDKPATCQRPQTRREEDKEEDTREREERETTHPTCNEPATAPGTAGTQKSTPRRKKSPKPDFTGGQPFKNPGFTLPFCATQWNEWCRHKKAPYRTQEVAEEALCYLHELSNGNETLAAEALRVARISDWQSFHWHFQHLSKQQGHDPTTQPHYQDSSHGAANLLWLQSHT